MNNLKSIEELQGILSQAIEELDLINEPSELYNPIRYLINLGGKHLRPVLVLIIARYQISAKCLKHSPRFLVDQVQ